MKKAAIIVLVCSFYFGASATAQSLPERVLFSADCLVFFDQANRRNLPDPDARGLTGRQIGEFLAAEIEPYQSHRATLLSRSASAGFRAGRGTDEALMAATQRCVDFVWSNIGGR